MGRKGMKKNYLCIFLTVLLLWAGLPQGMADDGTFTDTRFQGKYTTENLDAIIEEYELYDTWYWSTPGWTYQTFHGQEGKKGWTQTSKEIHDPFIYSWGWFGCRWNWNMVDPGEPNREGWGECFGFCQFLGYLLSGERNPHRYWVPFRSIREAGGLKPGDIVRIEYTDDMGFHQHSAMVYSVDEDKGEFGHALFLQVSGGNYNRLYIRRGYTGAGLAGSTDLTDIMICPGVSILRAEENLNGVYPRNWFPEKRDE